MLSLSRVGGVRRTHLRRPCEREGPSVMKTGMESRVRKDDERRDGGVGILGTQRCRDEINSDYFRTAAPLREVLVEVIVAATREGALLSFCFLSPCVAACSARL